MKQRVARWDNLKFILICCVVLGHFLARIDDLPNAQRLIFFIYLFHMPAFIFVSGLMSAKTVQQKRYKSIFRYLLVFLLIKLVLFALRVVFSHRTDLNLLEMNDISWYAFALFVFYLITIVIRSLPPVPVLFVSVLMACAVGYVPVIGTFLSLSRIFTFYPFFLAGYYLDAADVIAFVRKRTVYAGAWCVLTAALLTVILKIDRIWWLLRILKGKTPYADLTQWNAAGSFLRIVWYGAAAVLIVSVTAITPEKKSFITLFGRRTLQVYVLHYVPLSIFFRAMNGKELAMNSRNSTLVVVIAALVSTILLSVIPIGFPQKRDNTGA